MIRYLISLQELEKRVDAHKSNWRTRAKKRTEELKRKRRYEESSTIWSEIKEVYMELQHNKCAYCERQLASAEFGGRAEHDLEHYRPKSKSLAWKLPSELQNNQIVLTQPISGNADHGYYLLAYHLFNYCVACKPCNSGLKGTYFPISSTRTPSGTDPIQLQQTEEPLLIYPIGDFDVDPSHLIRFHGLSPMAVGQSHRGAATIAFFKLDDQRRKYLFRQRAELITTLFSFLENSTDLNKTPNDRNIYSHLIDAWTSPQRAHTNCGRCFRELYANDYDKAKLVFEAAAKYLDSIS